MKLKECSLLFTDGNWIESKDQSDSGLRLIQTGNVGNGKYLEKAERAKYISEETFARLKCTEIFQGDILISRLPEPVGRACVIPEKEERMITAVDCTILRVDEKIVDKRYLLHFLKSQVYYRNLCSKLAGTTRVRISRKNLEQIEIPIPDRVTQVNVGNVLDCIEKIIDQRKVQIELLDNLITSRFIEMFGNPSTNSKGWIKKKLSDECDIVTGNTPSRQVSEYYGDYIEWIKSDNINTPSATITKATEYLSEAGLSVARSVEAGSILMTCIAGSIKCIGNVAITDRKVSFNQQINGIVPRKNNTWFIYEQFELSKPYIQSTINMSLKGILSKGQLSEIEFVFPPTDLQNEFGVFAQQVDNLKVEVQKSLDETQQLFDSLMQQYFD